MKISLFNEIEYFLEKKSKIYFLKKKINDFMLRSNCKKRWTIRDIRKYEYKWKKLYKNYSQINIFGIEFVGIGETIPRIFTYLEDKKKKDITQYNIILPVFFQYYKGSVFNEKIFDIFRNDINFITKKNVGFWSYIIFRRSNKININEFNKYYHRKIGKFYIKDCKNNILFSRTMERYAQKKLQQMKIEKEYICIHAREENTKLINFYNYPGTSVCDVDIESFKSSVAYLQSLGFQVIRMGKDEKSKCEIENVIDYANDFYDELMDFYLIANCKFLIGCESGLTLITPFWGKPILVTNVNVFCYGFESMPTTEYDLYIPKKFYSMKEKRFLNLYEILEISNKCDRYDNNFAKEGIKLIDNTNEEILKATEEMNKKLNKTWVQTKQEEEYMEEYWKIMKNWRVRHKTSITRKKNGALGYEMISMPICFSFLIEHLYLLDIKEQDNGF